MNEPTKPNWFEIARGICQPSEAQVLSDMPEKQPLTEADVDVLARLYKEPKYRRATPHEL